MNWKGFKSREVGSEANLGSRLHLLASPKIVARMQKIVYRAAGCGTVYK